MNSIKLYENLAKKIELISEYRKRLNKIVDMQNDYQERLAKIVEPKKYFEKSAELTELEQRKILFKILTEQEEMLTKEVIFKDILDMDHFKDYMKSVIRAFKTPSVMGFKPILQNRLHLGHCPVSSKHVDRRHVSRGLHGTSRIRYQ